MCRGTDCSIASCNLSVVHLTAVVSLTALEVQLEICLRQLGDPASEAITILTALEALARLCWNDDEVRAQVSMLDGEHSHTTTPLGLPTLCMRLCELRGYDAFSPQLSLVFRA